MTDKDSEFLKRLLATFIIEAQEHVNALSAGFVELEKTKTPEEQLKIIETVFREAHSFKGAARSVNMADIEKLCQSLENVFAALKRHEITLSPSLFDAFHKTVDSIGDHLSHQIPLGQSLISRLVLSLEHLIGDKRPADGEPVPDQQSPVTDAIDQPHDQQPLTPGTVRISSAKLDSLLLQTEELLSAKLSAGRQAADLRDVVAMLDLWDEEWTKGYPELQRLHHALKRKEKSRQAGTDLELTKLIEIFTENHARIKSIGSRLKTLTASSERNYHITGRMVDALLQDMRRAGMLPFSSILATFPKFVRDLSRDRGKEADLVIPEADIEIDRRILEEMKDPLIHLIRNCIDHGIEKPEERKQKKKPERGTVTISISQKSSSRIEVLIADDGAGIDMAKVKASSLRLGIVSREEKDTLGKQEALALIFRSGVSTSPIITDISGRGLGLAIVQEKVDKLGGMISVETYPDTGTTFRILLPLTLASFRGVLVRVSEQIFVVPSANLDRIVRVKKDDIRTVENRETIGLNGRAVSLVRLHDVLGIPRAGKNGSGQEHILALIIGSPEKRIAFSVDEVVDEQEVLVKSLGRQLSRVRNIAGATVLATGKVVPVLNVSDLVKAAVKAPAAPVRAAVEKAAIEIKGKSALVVEDSITSRTLLKNILESDGYRVKTAVDGIDAFTILRTEAFDIVVSDVDMPRMSGFDLTTKIRSDKKLSDLPVVLVTALESHEDRERGIDVGANAYIVKSSFDQSNLLEIIRRLI